MIACSAWLMFVPTPIWDAIYPINGRTTLVPDSWTLDQEPRQVESVVQIWADDATELARTVGALVSLVLAFRSNLSRLPAPPPTGPGALKAAREAILDVTQEAARETAPEASPPDPNTAKDAEPADWATGTAIELTRDSTLILNVSSFVRRLAQWMGLGHQPGPFESEFCRLIGQHQQWFLFDRPSRHDHWYVTLGRCKDGTYIDLFNSVFSDSVARDHKAEALHVDSESDAAGGSGDDKLSIVFPVLQSPAPPWSITYRSHRWRKWFGRISEEGGAALRAPYAQFLCRHWNQRARACGKPEKRVNAVEMYCIRRSIPHSTPPDNWDLSWPKSCGHNQQQQQQHLQQEATSSSDDGGAATDSAATDIDSEPDPVQPFDRRKPVRLP